MQPHRLISSGSTHSLPKDINRQPSSASLPEGNVFEIVCLALSCSALAAQVRETCPSFSRVCKCTNTRCREVEERTRMTHGNEQNKPANSSITVTTNTQRYEPPNPCKKMTVALCDSEGECSMVESPLFVLACTGVEICKKTKTTKKSSVAFNIFPNL